MRWILRRRYLIASIVAAAVAGVALVGFLSPKEWESTTVVAVEPLQVAGLRSSGGDLPPPEEAIAAEAAIAGGDPFRSAVLEGFEYPVTFEVRGDAEHGTLVFDVRADSAERSWYAAFSIANGYIAWGRALEPTAAVAELQAQVQLIEQGQPPPAGTTLEGLQGEIATRQAAVDQLAAGGGRIAVAPEVPDDPVAPDFVARLVLAVMGGLLVGLTLAYWLDRRSTNEVEQSVAGPMPSRGQRCSRLVLGVITAILPVVVLASLIAGVNQVWEMRPTTAATDEQNYACLERWVASIPDGRTLRVETDIAFFRDQFQEFAFPRVHVADDDHPADAVLRIVPGPGPQECGGYHLEPAP